MKSLFPIMTLVLAVNSAKAETLTQYDRCSTENLSYSQAVDRNQWLRKCVLQYNGLFKEITTENLQFFMSYSVGNAVEIRSWTKYPVFGNKTANWKPGKDCQMPDDIEFVAVCDASESTSISIIPPVAPVAPAQPPPPPPKPPKEPREPREPHCPPKLCW